MPAVDEQDPDAIPATLAALDQWVCWRVQERGGKPTKIPIDPTTGNFGSATDADTWTDLETAQEYATRDSVDGIGFVFTDDDPIVGVDLDDCRVPETGTGADWATEIIDTLNSYTEISPSGTGYHVLLAGTIPGDRRRRGDIEIYEAGRFFTMTGAHVSETPTEIRERQSALETVYTEQLAEDTDGGSDTDDTSADPSDTTETVSTSTEEGSSRTGHDLSDEALLDRATSAANGEKFSRLWRGQTAGYESHSEADMALCSLLAFWTGGDPDRVDSLFRESGLMREKWDEVHYSDGSTYGEKTVERAVAGVDDVYEPGGTDNMESTLRSGSEDRTATADQHDPRSERQLETIEALEAELQRLDAERADLQAALESERARRRELERKLENQERDTSLWERLRGHVVSANVFER